MNLINKAEKYIESTRISNHNQVVYDMKTDLFFELARMDALEAISLAFKYGRAKGYRARKAEERHE